MRSIPPNYTLFYTEYVTILPGDNRKNSCHTARQQAGMRKAVIRGTGLTYHDRFTRSHCAQPIVYQDGGMLFTVPSV